MVLIIVLIVLIFVVLSLPNWSGANKKEKNKEEKPEMILNEEYEEELNYERGVKLMDNIKKLAKGIGLALGVLLLIFCITTSVFTVKQGSVAIITRFGKVVDVKEPGLNFKIPFVDRRTTMVTREQTIKFGKDEEFRPLTVSTKDMQTINLDLTVSDITTDPLKVYKSFTGRQLESLLLPRIKDAVQTNISRYTIEQFVSQRAKLAEDIFNDIKKDFEPYGILITNVSITNHDFSDTYEKAVEDKKVAEQSVETEKALQQKKVVEQESRVKLAKLKLEERKLEAEANKVETSSITEPLLKKWWIEKWDGKMPKVSGSSQGIILSEDMIGNNISE